jgi:hypothetical protein
MKKIIVVCIFLLCGFSYLNALTTWTGNVSNNWNDPGNWDNGVPDQTTDALIPDQSSCARDPMISSGDAPCANLTNNGSLSVQNGFSLNIQNNYFSGSAGNLDLFNSDANVGGTMNNGGTVNVSDPYAAGTSSINCGTYSAEANSQTNINDNGELNCTQFSAASDSETELNSGGSLSATHLNDNGSIAENGGTIACDDFALGSDSSVEISNGSFNSTGGGTFANGSVLDLSGNGSFRFDGDVSFDGTATIDGNATLWAGGSDNPIFNAGTTGTVTVNSGYFSIESYVSNGTTNINGGGAYWSSSTNNGTFNLESGSANTYDGFINNGTFNQTGGTGNFGGGFTLESGSTNQQSGGTLNIGGDASFSSSLINTGSNGEIVFNGGTTQTVTNPPGMPYTNMLPSVVVNNNSTVLFSDRVSFYTDNLSIQNATLQVQNAYLGETTVGGGTLQLDGGTLNVDGNNSMPEFNTNSMNSTSKVVYSSTTTDQTVKGLNYPTLEVSGTNKTLDGNASVSQEMILNTIFDVGNYNLTLLNGATLTPGTNKFFATTGSGYLIRNNISSGDFPIGPDVSNYNGFSFDNNGTMLNHIGARVETGITPTHPNAMYCLQRTWDIIKDGLLNANFTFKWLQTQETQPFEQARVNNRIVGHVCHTPSSWQVISTPSGATGTGMLDDPYKVDLGPMVLVSGFCLGDGDHTLPVQLSSFNAVYSNDAGLEFVQVNWATSTETDVLGYNVYQSIADEFDDAMKINAGLIPGQGTTTVGHSYSYDDLDADIGLRNYYWIEQMDYSGLSELFGPAVYIPEGGGEPGPDDFTESRVLQQYPNPVENNMKIEYQIKGSADQQDAVIYIYNMKGEFVDTVFGQNGIAEIDLSHYATGVYFYRLQDTSLGETYKFVVIR